MVCGGTRLRVTWTVHGAGKGAGKGMVVVSWNRGIGWQQKLCLPWSPSAWSESESESHPAMSCRRRRFLRRRSSLFAWLALALGALASELLWLGGGLVVVSSNWNHYMQHTKSCSSLSLVFCKQQASCWGESLANSLDIWSISMSYRRSLLALITIDSELPVSPYVSGKELARSSLLHFPIICRDTDNTIVIHLKYDLNLRNPRCSRRNPGKLKSTKQKIISGEPVIRLEDLD